jgi:hypothetical protein
MRKPFWLFRKLSLSLRMEVIINISLLMLAAILLIGFSMTKIQERQIIQEKMRYGEGMTQDVQAMIEYLLRGHRMASLSDPMMREEVQEFVRIYSREKGPFELRITDESQRIVASNKTERIGSNEMHSSLKQALQTGHFHTDMETSGSFLWTRYQKFIFSSPLWIRGKIIGGIQMEVPAEDLPLRLLESKRIILISILLDAVVLIIFGSFLLSRVLVKPLRELVRLTQKISEGDFSQTIEVSPAREIGKLIDSFNRMILRLRENQESLESHLESLETTNKKLKQAQEELLRTEKLASIGRFAAGVAHEVGNPLGAILGYTSILEQDGIEGEEAKDYLKRIEREIERINRIVRELLDFARPSRGEVKEIDVNPVLQNTLSLLSFQKGFKHIQTEIDLQPRLPRVRGDETQLSQVFVNMILNALDAMPDGGTLRIQTRTFIVEAPLSDPLQKLYPPRRKGDPLAADYSHLRKPDPLSTMLTKFSRGDSLVQIIISDTGTGIKEEDLKQIFDPFFTTKDPDRGTGLGLSVSLRIVESTGGEIKVESQLGIGTRFEIYLPALQEEVEAK